MTITVYAIYVVTSIIITYWVGHTLNTNGRLFLTKIFNDNVSLADSVNHLLLVGFYLMNMGFITLTLKFGDKPTDTIGAVEFLSTKIGFAIAVLGLMHFFNMYCLMKFRNFRFQTHPVSR